MSGEPLAPLPPRSGRTTPRETALGRHPCEKAFRANLRVDDRPRRPRARSAGPVRGSAADARRHAHMYGESAGISAAENERDDDWRASSRRYCNSHFYDTLRSWHGLRDVRETTRGDWRVSSADNLGMKGAEGAYGHDQSTNDADGWKRSSSVWVESSFRGGLRDYKGVDMRDEVGRAKGTEKDQKHQAGTNLGSIYRSTKQAEVLTAARADETFLGSLRAAAPRRAEDYQRTRRAHLNLPQYRDLSAEQVTKAKRVFATIDLDGSGSVDADEIRKFLVSMGHKSTGKAVDQLIKSVEEGPQNSKLALKEFARLYHGLKL